MTRRVDVLECGTPLVRLVDQVADRSPPADARHQAECEYCARTIGDLDQVYRDVATLAAETVTPPPGFSRRVVRRIRHLQVAGEPRSRPTTPAPAVWVRLPSGGPGATVIGDTALARAAKAAAAGVDGARVVQAAVRQAAGRVVVDVTIVVAWGRSAPTAAARVRADVHAGMARLVGLGDVAVDVTLAGFDQPAAHLR